MMTVDHLAADQMLTFVEEGMKDPVFEQHVLDCAVCRSRLADTLVLIGGLAPVNGSPDRPDMIARYAKMEHLLQDSVSFGIGRAKWHRQVGMHVSAETFREFYAAAYEWESAGREFFQAARHLRSCDACFSEFLRLSRNLAPRAQTLKSITNSVAPHRSDRSVGILQVLELVERYVLSFLESVSPEPREGHDVGLLYSWASPSLSLPRKQVLDVSWNSARDIEQSNVILSSASRELSRERLLSDFGDHIEINLDRIRLLVAVPGRAHDRRLYFHAEDRSSGRPLSGVEVTVEDHDGFLAASAVSDDSGTASLTIDVGSVRFKAQFEGKVWSLDLKFRSVEALKAEQAEAESAAQKAERQARKKEVERKKSAAAQLRALIHAEFAAKFRELRPVEQLREAAGEERPIWQYQDLLPDLSSELLAQLDLQTLDALRNRLGIAKRGRLARLHKDLVAYLESRVG